MSRRFALAAAAALVIVLSSLIASTAIASPVATSEDEYQALGRVFPDPLAGCQNAGSSPCSPNAQGNVPANQFIQFPEFLSALKYMNQKPDWQRYMEVWALDGKDGDGSGTGLGGDAFPGNNLGKLEFTPNARFQSAGLATTDGGREHNDMMVVRVTDETVPDDGKKRYALSLSIHGIERAGVEGGTRAMEDAVSAYTTKLQNGETRANTPVIPREIDPNAPTFGEMMKKTIIYFTYPNPDGWLRGSVSTGRVFFQRYNGNGVDLNRDWPDIGFSFRPYSGLSEPESRALASFFDDVRVKGGRFAAGDDLHGQPFADALSYTLLPHGRHPFDKDIRIRETAKTIHNNSEQALSWSPIIQPNDAPQGGGVGCAPDTPVGTPCSKIYGQTWGSVYDTINYTTTGALGDYFDSSVGLGADGIDNEMSFSHLDKNINFDPHTEQLHVDGNKALIYAHLAELDHPATGKFDAPGRKGYVPGTRVKRGATEFPGAPPGTKPHDPIDRGPTDTSPDPDGIVIPITNDDTKSIGGPGIFNGGMRVDVRATNAQGVGTGTVTLAVQCKGCDAHRSVEPGAENEWITVAEDYNQSPAYAQAGITASVNLPQAEAGPGKNVEWRALVSPQAGLTNTHIEFTQGPATTDGNTGGDNPPTQKAYDVANTDFFRELDEQVAKPSEDFDTVDPKAVLSGSQKLSDFESVVLADDPLPGYKGPYGGRQLPTGGPTADFEFDGTASPPAADAGPGVVPGSTYEKDFTIDPNSGNGSAKIRIDWGNQQNDFDMYVYREEDGKRTLAGKSASTQGTTNYEEVNLPQPPPGKYIVQVFNYASAEPTFHGKVSFTPLPPAASDTGAFSVAEKDRWAAKLREYAEGGGNLVLTDGALQLLPELTGIKGNAVAKQTVYAGQTTFATASGKNTNDDRLARFVAQPGARFNSGNRRQMFEPTPLGFAIQNASGSDESNARQYDVDKAEWEKAGGRTAGTSADSGTRDAAPVYSRVTLGELKKGKGQIRIAGALLPQPTEEFDHPYGLEPYAVTYTGYIVMRNLLDTTASGLRGLPGARDSGTGRNFVISRRAVKLKKRVAAVRVSCRSPKGCKGTLVLKMRKVVRVRGKRKARNVTLGKKKFSYPAKKRNALVRVKLSRKSAAAASRKRRTKVTAVASVRFGDGTRDKPSRKFLLYRPSGKKKR